MESMSKQELYLEKLQKWREGKQKEKENRLAMMSAKKGKSTTKNLPISVVSKASVQTSTRRPLLASANKADSRQTSVRQVFSSARKNSSSSSQGALTKISSKSAVKSESKTVVQNVAKPAPKSSVTASHNGPKTANDTSKFKFVKSRLFDFQSKQKPQSTVRVDHKNGRVAVAGAKTDQRKSNVTRPEVKPKLKRRHSVVSSSDVECKKLRRPSGILKRKSCYGSLDLTKSRHSTNDDQEDMEDDHNGKGENFDNVFPETETKLELAGSTPGHTRNVRFISPDISSPVDSRMLRKTPAVRRSGLNDWLKAKGRTPSKFRHLMCFHGDHGEGDGQAVQPCDSLTKSSLTVDELTEQLSVIQCEQLLAETKAKLDIMLEECMTLFEAGCPSNAILPWLDDISSKIPYAKSSAKFYKCKAEVIKSTLDLDALLEVFEEATINNAQPGTELAKCLTETIKYVTEEKVRKARRRSRTPRRSEVQEENIFVSSTVAYSVTEATPLSSSKKRSSSRNRASTGGGTPVHVVTPVRRSTRRSLQCLPDSLKDKNETFSSLRAVQDKEGDNLLFHPNLALDSVLAKADD